MLHPDVEVRLSAFAEPDLWLRGREAVLRWYRRTAGSHRAYLHRVQEAVPDGVARVRAHADHQSRKRGMRDYQVVWMVAIRDGLVWRARLRARDRGPGTRGRQLAPSLGRAFEAAAAACAFGLRVDLGSEEQGEAESQSHVSITITAERVPHVLL